MRFTVTGPEAWIGVTTGSGTVLVAQTFAPGESRQFDNRELVVRTGKAPAVRFVVNGRERPTGTGDIEQFTVRRKDGS